MKVTANGTLTSPVKRGVWVAERLLGTPIPPPPPNIDPVDPDTRGAKTLREQLAAARQPEIVRDLSCQVRSLRLRIGETRRDEQLSDKLQHRRDPSIKRMSRWKNGLPVDSTGVTPDGKAFAGVKELREMLARSPEQLARGVTRHLLTYATGQPATPLDQATIEAILKGAAKERIRSAVR